MFAPRGRVSMHASQNDITGPAPSLQASKTTTINVAGRSTDGSGTHPVSSSVHSPAAVLSANVTKHGEPVQRFATCR